MILELLAAATAGGFIGFFTCAVMTMGKVGDNAAIAEIIADRDWWKNAHADEWDMAERMAASAEEHCAKLEDAHARAADALATKQARIDRALSCETPKAAHGVKKMARILRGDA